MAQGSVVVADDFEDGILDPLLWVAKGPGSVLEQNGRAESFDDGQLTSVAEFDPDHSPLVYRGEFTMVSHGTQSPFVIIQWRAEFEDTLDPQMSGAKADAQVAFYYPGGAGPGYTTEVAIHDYLAVNSVSSPFRVDVGDTVSFIITDDAGSVTADLVNNNSAASASLTFQIQSRNAFGNHFKFSGRASPYNTVPGMEWLEILRLDSDLDGLLDSAEDQNANGIVDPGETDPFDQDTDDDGLSDGEEVFNSVPDPTWTQLTANQHWYRLLRPRLWNDAEDAAVALGGHLATIRDQAEQDWLYERFGMHRLRAGMTWWSLSPWIGLTDQWMESRWEWASGEPFNYENWGPGEPNNWGGNEDHALIVHASQPEAGDWWDVADQPHFGIVELDVAAPPHGFTDPLDPDTDRDGILDGTELGVTVGWPGDPVNNIGGTDPGVFVPDADPLTTTSPIDNDHDDDGMADGDEDLDLNGRVDAGETDPENPDSDGDGLQDGLETGEVDRLIGSNYDLFIPDGDPATTTDPANADTDGGGMPDGQEDLNLNGAYDLPFELDPNDPLDDTVALTVPPLVRGQFATLVTDGVRKDSTTWFCYSLAGPGSFTHPTYGFTMGISPTIEVLGSATATTAGSVGYSATVPSTLPVGLTIWCQSVEAWGQPPVSFRVSELEVATVQ